MYLTAAELMQRFDESELAQVAPPDSGPRVEAGLMRAVILGESTTAWAADEIAAAQEGVVRINEAITDAGQQVDGHLGQRYTLPLDPVPSLIKRLAANIARFYLHDDGATEEIDSRYKEAVRVLGQIRDGKMSLGIDQPDTSKTGSAEIESADVVWRRDQSNGYI
jgi:phage gp36-like protein